MQRGGDSIAAREIRVGGGRSPAVGAQQLAHHGQPLRTQAERVAGAWLRLSLRRGHVLVRRSGMNPRGPQAGGLLGEAAFVTGIIALAHSMDLQVVAEAATAEQASASVAMQCPPKSSPGRAAVNEHAPLPPGSGCCEPPSAEPPLVS